MVKKFLYSGLIIKIKSKAIVRTFNLKRSSSVKQQFVYKKTIENNQHLRNVTLCFNNACNNLHIVANISIVMDNLKVKSMNQS